MLGQAHAIIVAMFIGYGINVFQFNPVRPR
jgi:hypothetical protein